MDLTYASLAKMGNAQQRGYAFQEYVAGLLRREHFQIEGRPTAANRRQVDLFASRGDRHLLIETKWRKAPVGLPDVDDLVKRLEATTPGVVGVLISATGFSGSAAQRVEQHVSRPVLLVSGEELQRVENGETLHRLLSSKLERLTVHRQAAVASAEMKSPTTRSQGTRVEGRYRFVTQDGKRESSVELAGGFSPIAFGLELLDMDWLDGHGVALELPLSGYDSRRLLEIFERLTDRGWITESGTWRICQQGATWVGFGLSSLLDAIERPDERYQGRTMHHSETLAYVDTALGGIYALTATLTRTRPDRVSLMTLSFRLPGIPLDPGPIQTLVRGLEIDIDPVFRSLSKSITRRIWPERVRHKQALESVALIVANPPMRVIGAGDNQPDEEWVVGAIVRNPLLSRTHDLIDSLAISGRRQEADYSFSSSDDEFLVCGLGSWHYLSERKNYELKFIDTSIVGDAIVARPWLDWADEQSAVDLATDATGGFAPAAELRRIFDAGVRKAQHRLGR